MIETIRISTAVFKNNPRPFVQRAKEGFDVIVTNEGKDDFKIVPVNFIGCPPVSKKPIPAELYAGIDVDEPAFPPMS